jgi:hypothetical protein
MDIPALLSEGTKKEHFTYSRSRVNTHLNGKGYSPIVQTNQDPQTNIQLIYRRYCRTQVKWTVADFSPWKPEFYPSASATRNAQSGTRTGFFQSNFGLSINSHSTIAPYELIHHPELIQEHH